MHVINATDGSRQSLTAARFATTVVDATKVRAISVLAVVRPLAAVSFSNELGSASRAKPIGEGASFRAEAEAAIDVVAEVFEGWGHKVHKRTRSGSPANEIIRAATQLGAGPVVVANGSRGISERSCSAARLSACSTTRRVPCSSSDRPRSLDGRRSPDQRPRRPRASACSSRKRRALPSCQATELLLK